MYFYFMRHGQSEENTREWDGNNLNSPLTDLGHQQAQALAEWAAQHLTIQLIYASPMLRTRQTAEYLAHALKLPITFDNRLREVGNAYPDGSPFPDDNLPSYVLGRWGSREPYKAITHQGENWMQFRARVGGFVETLVAEAGDQHIEQSVAVVCHGGVIDGVFEHVFQKGPLSEVVVHTYNTGITHLEYVPKEGMPDWWLYYHNQTRHLTPDQIT
jgi:broad specificity phosphatase PhoE